MRHALCRCQYQAAIAHCGFHDPKSSQTAARLTARFPSTDPAAADLLHKLLAFDPSQRITVEQALVPPWLQEYHVTSQEPSCATPFDFSWEAQYDLSDKQTLRQRCSCRRWRTFASSRHQRRDSCNTVYFPPLSPCT